MGFFKICFIQVTKRKHGYVLDGDIINTAIFKMVYSIESMRNKSFLESINYLLFLFVVYFFVFFFGASLRQIELGLSFLKCAKTHVIKFDLEKLEEIPKSFILKEFIIKIDSEICIKIKNIIFIFK